MLFTFLDPIRGPDSNVAAKEKAVSKGPTNILAFVGSDESRIKEAALNCFGKLVSPEEAEFGAEVIDGTAENAEGAVKVLSQTIGALQTLPFFGGHKVVWLKGATLFADSQTGKAASVLDAAEALISVLEDGLSDGVTFLVSAPSIDKRRAFYKKLSKLGHVEIFDRPDMSRDGWQDQVKGHVRKLAKERGLQFDAEALELFVMLAGSDLSQIGNELEKIDLFLAQDDRRVTVEHVRKQVALTRAGVIFELGNHIARRNLSGALETIDHLLYQGENAIGILLAAVVPTMRRLLIAKDLAERHGIKGGSNYRSYESALSCLSATDIEHLPRKKDGGLNVYPIFLAASESLQFPSWKLRKGLVDCLQANRALVTSSLDHRIILERLVIRLLSDAA